MLYTISLTVSYTANPFATNFAVEIQIQHDNTHVEIQWNMGHYEPVPSMNPLKVC